MKYGNINYVQLPREIFQKRDPKLSTSAKWLFCVLNELEHRYADDRGLFFRSNEDLANDAELSPGTIKTAKKELVEAGLISVNKIHFRDVDTGKISKKYISGYRILV